MRNQPEFVEIMTETAAGNRVVDIYNAGIARNNGTVAIGKIAGFLYRIVIRDAGRIELSGDVNIYNAVYMGRLCRSSKLRIAGAGVAQVTSIMHGVDMDCMHPVHRGSGMAETAAGDRVGYLHPSRVPGKEISVAVN